MRDFLLNESIKRLATEAATRLSSLVAMGEEIPFDVAAESGDDSAFYSYVPMTGRYVAEHGDELRALPGFAPAREAAVEAGVAAPYLEERGESVPADPGARAELMLITFFSELWEGSAGFTLDRERLDTALATLDAESRDADLAVAEQDSEGAVDGALQQLRELVSVMRLFKGGGIGLGPYAFAPTGEGCWRRIATGAPATRPGGYRLSEDEAEELIAFGTTLEARPDPDTALTWAVGRFEMGCERATALEGLSDHLLAMRAVLEGHGPVGASLPLRAAALIADEQMDRIEAGEKVEAVLGLERAMMNGRPVDRAVELATWTEEGVRGLLRQAALGELGNDLSTAADETLIVEGLAEGDAQITVSEGFEPEPEIETEAEPEIVEPDYAPDPEDGEISIEAIEPDPSAELRLPFDELPEEEDVEQETRIMEPVPAEDEIKITATPWLEEVSDPRGGDTIQWPADAERDLQHREKIDTPRVRHLFPVPDSDWDVEHLEFEYSRGNRAG